MSEKKQKTVDICELSTLRMTSGNEKKYPVVIFSGKIRHWVAIGWIGDEKAAPSDYEKYPVVTKNGKVLGEHPVKKKRSKKKAASSGSKRRGYLLESGLSGQDGTVEAVFLNKKSLRYYVKMEHPDAVGRNRKTPSEMYWEFDGSHGDPESGWIRATEVPIIT